MFPTRVTSLAYHGSYANRGIAYQRRGQDAKAEADKAKAYSLDSQKC